MNDSCDIKKKIDPWKEKLADFFVTVQGESQEKPHESCYYLSDNNKVFLLSLISWRSFRRIWS